MAGNKHQHTEYGEDDKSIEQFWRFSLAILTQFPVSTVTVIEWQQRLNSSWYPEEAYEAGDKEKHLPRANLYLTKVAFRKYNADNQERSEPQQLK